MQPETVLFHSDDSDAGTQDARAYIARFGLTSDQVRLIKKAGAVMVIAKVDVNC